MATKKPKVKKAAPTEFQWPFGKRNYIMFAVALVVIIIGYITLDAGSITLAPLLLVIGYVVLIPIALIIKDPSKHDEPESTEQGS